MASQRKDQKSTGRRRPPAMTPEAREKQMISLAFDTAEKQMQEGTASAQVITHYLKLGTTRERLEQQKMMREIDLLEKKAEAMISAQRMEELYEEAISAMRRYGGQDDLTIPEGDEFDA